MKTIKISVVIPTYNSLRTLIPCIESVQKQTLKPQEIIVIDNASTDKTFGQIQNLKIKNQNYKSKLKIFQNNNNLGVTGGRNRGIKEASNDSDYLFFFDHDMVADRKMLEELVEVAEKDSKIGIITPKIYYWEDRSRIWSAGTGINLWTGQVLFRGGKDIGQYEKAEEVQVAPAAMLVKKDVIKKIKRFDDKYFATYEDTDFCFRAKAAGFNTFYAPDAVAWHNLSTDRTDEVNRLLDRAYWVGRNRVLFMKDFGKNFLVFLVFLYFFTIYYIYLSIKQRRFRDGIRFIEGTISGIFN